MKVYLPEKRSISRAAGKGSVPTSLSAKKRVDRVVPGDLIDHRSQAPLSSPGPIYLQNECIYGMKMRNCYMILHVSNLKNVYFT